MTKPFIGVCSVSLALTVAASAQTPAGGEFRVNIYTLDAQFHHGAAMEPDGDFVVVWASFGSQDGNGAGVFGRRFAASGAARGGEFQINTHTTGFQSQPVVAFGGRQDFVAIWADAEPLSTTTIQLWLDNQPVTPTTIQGRRYDASGSPIGGEFRVATAAAGYLFPPWPRMSRASDGSFVVCWDSFSGAPLDVVARRSDASGNPLGAEFVVNTYAIGNQYGGDLAVDANGNFVVVWQDASGRDGSSSGIFGQRFDASGNRLGSEFQVNSYTTARQFSPSVSVSPTGAFVVAWDSTSGDGSGGAMFARRFDASGSPVGGDFVVNTYTTSSQYGGPGQVTLDARGNFVVAWAGPGDGSDLAIFAQRFSRTGARRGAEFQVNTYTTQDQSAPVIISDSVGNFVVVWASYGQDGSHYGVFAQRFGGLGPTALAVDSPGNHVLEPGETVDVRPAWRNFNGAAQTFGGTLTEMTGPAGATYTIVDPAGDYGTVRNNATGQCVDCYRVSVSDPNPRPAMHWDASVVETIVPDAQGQQKEWRLHVGRSFTDVSTGSPFYPFVETLLHHGVTGGCGGANYCPSAVTTRDQMSVLVLLAKEGAGYTPPACGMPMFNDVPASSPFCRYIQELARRGVVGGCGGGNYCPTAAVTREQMAIFVLRTLDPALNPPACGAPMFGDVPASSPFCRWIEELARRGAVTGCGGGNYCPTAAVTREQMSVFISATFGLTLYGP